MFVDFENDHVTQVNKWCPNPQRTTVESLYNGQRLSLIANWNFTTWHL